MEPDLYEAKLENKVKAPGDFHANFLHIFNSISDALIIHDINGNVFMMNAPAMKLCKVTENEVSRISIIDLAKDYSGFNLVSDCWPDVLLGNNRICEWSFVDIESKAKVSLQISMNPTVWDGKPAVIAVIRDFALRKKFEEKMNAARQKAEENEYKFRSLFEKASDGIFITDMKGNFLEVNESSCQMLGYTKEELLTLNIKDVVQAENKKSNPINKKGMESGNVVISERFLVRKDNSVFPAEISGSMYSDGRMQAIVRDISGQKKFEAELIESKEKAEASDRLKTAFLHNISHEIRTPLNAIMGFADLIPEYFNDRDKLTRYAEIISERGANLIEIIDDILIVARIESGQLTSNPEISSLDVFFSGLESFFNAYRLRMDKSMLEFRIQVSPQIRARSVEIDQTKLKQILVKLVENAFKFTTYGKVEIGCFINDPKELIFYVSDTGIGIPQELHSSIFTHFTKASPNFGQQFGGTGLGLSIVRGLLLILGGKIWLESESAKGSTFYFSIPLTTVTNPVTSQPKEQFETLADLKKPTFLIVDNDYYSAEYLKELLAEEGFTFIHTSSGQKAIEICSEHSFDLVLIDLHLPDRIGFEVIAQIRKNNPQQKIIAQTTYAFPGEKEKAIAAGCSDYFNKPLKRDLLLSRIGSLITKVGGIHK